MKRTKKIMGIMMALMLVLALMLSACGGNNATTGNNQPTDSKPTGAPTTSSTSKTDPTGKLTITVTPDTIEIYAGDDYDLMFGVTVDNADATLRISDSGDFDETTPGTYGEVIAACGLPANVRGETLSIAQFAELANEIFRRKQNG